MKFVIVKNMNTYVKIYIQLDHRRQRIKPPPQKKKLRGSYFHKGSAKRHIRKKH